MKKSVLYICIFLIIVLTVITIIGTQEVIHELFFKTCTDADFGHAYEISSDVIFADEASISNLYVGENEERLRVCNIEISEDGKSLTIYFVDSDPIIFGGVTNE